MSLQDKLKTAVTEKDIENMYRAELLRHFQGGYITSPFNSDGLLEYENIKTLLEFKYGKNLKDNKEQASVFAQVLFYMKRFEESGQKMPNTIFVGDNTECLALSTQVLDKYLRKTIDWSTAPSHAYKLHPELVREIANDHEILTYVFDIDIDDFKEVAKKIEELAEGIVNLVTIDQSNIIEAFRYWRENILNDAKKTTQEEVNIFVKCLIDREDTYEHPRKAGVLVTTVNERNVEVRVKMKAHLSFFSHFKREYKPSERIVIVSNKDRLVDEVDRRKTGEFFTPTIWAKEAHKVVEEKLGENWTDEYVVWDCSSGTNNLTRDIRFKELYCSTLNEEDIDTAQKMGYNPEATFFQFDFLNDSDDKLPVRLRNALYSGKVLFLINPPYATSANNNKGKNKQGVGVNMVADSMRKEKMGVATQQMYAQFLYRIKKYKEVNEDISIGLFSKSTFVSSYSFGKFYEDFTQLFGFSGGFLFKASHFADVSGAWGVMFSLWTTDGVQEVLVDLKDVNKKFEVVKVGEKELYQVRTNLYSKYVKSLKSTEKEKVRVLPITNPITVKYSGEVRVKELEKDYIGYLNSGGNSVMQNNMMSGIYTSAYSNGNGIKIDRDNLGGIVTLFSTRRLITGRYSNWVNDKDEYLIPNFELDGYEKWSKDAYIYSLFQTASYQSALRNVEYNDTEWNIKNEFFFMSNEEMKILADEHNFIEMYNDTNYYSEDRYVYELLLEMEVSEDAKNILDSAKELIRKSMRYRKESHQLRPEYHLHAWDCGWYQVRKGIIEHYPDLKEELKEFQLKFKEFEDRMREGVYKYGFLKQ